MRVLLAAVFLALAPQSVDDLIRRLGDADPAVRDVAEAKLRGMGTAVEAELRKAEQDPDPEVRGRVQGLLRSLAGFLAYVRGDNGGVIRLDVDGTNPVELAWWDEGAAYWDLAWSPHGRRLAFVGWFSTHRLFTVGLNGEGFETAALGRDVGGFSWSPDGRRLAYEQEGDESEPSEPLTNQIHVVDADGRNDVQLTQEADYESSPAWSPDGRWIAFARSESQQIRQGGTVTVHHCMDLHIMSPEGKDRRQLTKIGMPIGVPAWSPDGKRISFVTGPEDSDWICCVNADGSGFRKLVEYGSGWAIIRPMWFPDGSRLLYGLHREEPKEDSLMILDVRSLERRRFGAADIPQEDAAISPDGKRVVFRSGSDLYVVDADGGNRRKIAGDAGGSVSWGPAPK